MAGCIAVSVTVEGIEPGRIEAILKRRRRRRRTRRRFSAGFKQQVEARLAA